MKPGTRFIYQPWKYTEEGLLRRLFSVCFCGNNIRLFQIESPMITKQMWKYKRI